MIKKIAMGAAVLLASSAGAQAMNISLDGYCNTFKITLSGFETYGKRSGCGYTLIDGGTVAEINGVTWVISNDINIRTKKPLYTWYFTPISKGVGNWYLYGSDGKSETEMNSGTYSAIRKTDSPKAGGKDATLGR